MTLVAEYQLMGKVQVRTGNVVRYNEVKKQKLFGMTFDSKAEAHMYLYLKQLETVGEIKDIRHQIQITLLDGPVKMRRTYKVDFSYVDVKSGEQIFVEVKGWQTDRWKANLLLWRHIGPGPLRVYSCAWGKLQLVEEVFPDDAYLRKKLGLNL